MYPFLDRRLRKLSTETLFTQFGLQMNKLEEEKRRKKVTSWRILKIKHSSQFQKCSFWLYLDSSLSNLSNETKITQNEVRMKKLWSKQNGAEVECENFAQCEISHGAAKISHPSAKLLDFPFSLYPASSPSKI